MPVDRLATATEMLHGPIVDELESFERQAMALRWPFVVLLQRKKPNEPHERGVVSALSRSSLFKAKSLPKLGTLL